MNQAEPQSINNMSIQTTPPNTVCPPVHGKKTRPGDPWHGQRVGEYHLRKVLGRTNDCTVFRGLSAAGEPVIAKVFHNDGPIRRRALQEACAALRQLDRDDIVRPLGVEETRSARPVLIRPYVEGVNILTWCDQNKLCFQKRLHLFLALCETVSHIHQSGLVHRGIKPGNIIVQSDGNMVITDLTVGGMFDVFTDPLIHLDPAKKAPAWYASPEQVLKHRVTKATDIYALGALFYHLITGSPPYSFDRRRPWEIRWMISCMDPERPGRHLIRTGNIQPDQENTLRGLDHIIDKSMAKQPEVRYASVEMLMADVRKVIHDGPINRPRGTVTRFLQKLKRASVFDR